MTLLEYEEKLFGKEEIELYVFLLDGVQEELDFLENEYINSGMF